MEWLLDSSQVDQIVADLIVNHYYQNQNAGNNKFGEADANVQVGVTVHPGAFSLYVHQKMNYH